MATIVLSTVCEVQGRVDGLADLAERLQLADGLRELARSCLDLVEQAHVLDRDHRLVGEGRDELDLLVRERPHRTARQHDDADRGALAQQRHAQNGAVAGLLLDVAHAVVRVRQDVGDVNGAALFQASAR